MENNCPKCGEGLGLAECENPSTGEKRELLVCDCGFRARATEVYSRVVGYLRPTSAWNKGKQAEFEERKTFKV